MTAPASPFSPDNSSQAVDRAAEWRVQESSLSEQASLLDRVKLRLKPDEELVALLQAGEADALTILFERHSPLVFRIARRILRNDAEAEDAVQQIFLDFYRAVSKFDPERGTFKAWLLMFAYHRTINQKNSLSSKRFYETDSLDDTAGEELIAASKRAFPFNTAETKRLVEQALGMVHARHRKTLELVYYEGLTPAEVAEKTGESVKTVRHNLYRGLDKVRAVLFEKAKKKQSKREDA